MSINTLKVLTMKFKDFLKESDKLSNLTLKELQLLLAHHLEDLEEYKGSDESAYEAAKEDITKIKAAISSLKEKKVKAPGNQAMGSGDAIAQTSAGAGDAAPAAE